MRILCVATKCPWPPRDGGRLVLSLTLQGLIDAGHDVAVVAPADVLPDAVPEHIALHRVGVRKRGWITATLQALGKGCAVTLARHDQPAIRAAAADCMAQWRPDIVHAEQLQAMANCMPAVAAGIPIALRMQNVESALWEQMAGPRFRGALLKIESRRLCAGEREAMAQAATTISLTAKDAGALAAIARPEDRARIACIEPPFPAAEPPGDVVDGDPALVVSGSSGWWPNARGERWFAEQIWPLLHAELPRARLHVFGGDISSPVVGVHRHIAPVQSQTAFPSGAIAIVPLLAASGIRMRILEAWARGLPVIATSIAARGLEVASGRELLIADSPREFLDAVLRASGDVALRHDLENAGRDYLRRHHDPVRQTQTLLAQYARAARGCVNA